MAEAGQGAASRASEIKKEAIRIARIPASRGFMGFLPPSTRKGRAEGIKPCGLIEQSILDTP